MSMGTKPLLHLLKAPTAMSCHTTWSSRSLMEFGQRSRYFHPDNPISEVVRAFYLLYFTGTYKMPSTTVYSTIPHGQEKEKKIKGTLCPFGAFPSSLLSCNHASQKSSQVGVGGVLEGGSHPPLEESLEWKFSTLGGAKAWPLRACQGGYHLWRALQEKD